MSRRTNMKLRSFTATLTAALAMVAANPSLAQKTLTIASPGYEKTITLDGTPPQVVLSYTPDGMRLEFSNIAMKMVCIEDPSQAGVCRLQAYDAEVVDAGPTISVPKQPNPPVATAGDAAVSLSWTAPDDGGAAITGYKIERVTPAPITVVTENTGSASTSYTVTGLNNDTGYTFRLAGINSEGTGFMSGVSATATPTAAAGPVTGTNYASACNGLSGDLECIKMYGDGDLEANAFKEVTVPAGKTLVVPFILETAANREGAFKFDSFYNVANPQAATWQAWLSSTPGQYTMFEAGNTEGCQTSGSYAQSTLLWSRGSKVGSTCHIGDSSVTGLLWLNMRFIDGQGNKLFYGATDIILE